MKLVSFDAFRTPRLPESHYIKPELFFTHLAEVREADWVLFPNTGRSILWFSASNSGFFRAWPPFEPDDAPLKPTPVWPLTL